MAKEFKMPDNVAECPHCHTLVEYTKEDIRGDHEFTAFGTVHWTYVECPKCKNQIQF